MKTGMKTMKALMMTAALALMTATFAYADANPANDSGSFTVRITPNVDLGVIVDTSGANWAGASTNLDMTSDLATDTLLDGAVGIAMAGNFGNQELTLTGVALNTWVLDTDEIDVQDQLALYAMFGRFTGAVGSPLLAQITGTANLIKTAATRAGQAQADEGGNTNHAYELSNVGADEYEDVDNMLSTATRKLWLRARTPSTTSTDGQAQFTVTVTATTGVGL